MTFSQFYSGQIECADEDGRYANAISQSYQQVLQSQQNKIALDQSKVSSESLKKALEQPVYQAPTYTAPAQECKQEKWTTADGVEMVGCSNPLSGDTNEYEWKDWEQALKDGDLCIVTTEGNVQKAKPAYEMPNGKCS
jgi:hypothetical protein